MCPGRTGSPTPWPSTSPSWTTTSPTPARNEWQAWHYRRRWGPVMTIGGLAELYRGRALLPMLGKVTSSGYTDQVRVRLVSGQSAADFAALADNLAHGFGAVLCRVRS